MRDSFGRKNGQQVRDQREVVGLAFTGALGLEPGKRDALSVIGSSSASVDKRGMESVYIVVLIIDEEPFSYSGVAVRKSVDVKPVLSATEKALLDFVREECALVRNDNGFLV